MIKEFKVCVIGRSNSGKSTLVSVLMEDINLAQQLHENNVKGKTKLNTEFVISNKEGSSTFELIINERFIDSLSANDVTEQFIKEYTDIIPDLSNLDCSSDDLIENIKKIIFNRINELKKESLSKVFSYSENNPKLRNIIEKLVVYAKASNYAQKLLNSNTIEQLRVMDTKGFGDETDLIDYEIPVVDAVIYMISDKLVDHDYKIVRSVISDQLKQIPVILCARGQNGIRIEEIEEIINSDDICKEFKEYCNDFNIAGTAAHDVKNCLYRDKILFHKSDNSKSLMEKFLGENLFMQLPTIVKEGAKSGKKLFQKSDVEDSKIIFTHIVVDIFKSLINAKIREEKAVENVISKVSTKADETFDSMYSIFKKYILEASLCLGYARSEQYKYYYHAVRSPEFFVENVHRAIIGPRGGNSGYYAYNYDRIAIGSHSCLELGFEEILEKGFGDWSYDEIELIIRKVRRNVCRFGKLSGYSEDYRAFLSYDRVVGGYKEEKDKNWKQHFTDDTYHYPYIKESIEKDTYLKNSPVSLIHAISIYWGVLSRIVEKALRDVIGGLPIEVQKLASYS
ncbi:GTPase domain-containing protein [Paenibacillus sp. LS1]|uniref:GTPase domain-containing protein n=1 Tax=Paenibacillus sp. LS1 TaxID=2992120 RepID=UPI00222F61FF|nr:GTPase domain-containing protein [Paenibacillus sp. LS1]MCW3792904.1 GTPase domain-containing protein [Paenibacillus sp. LS1]